MTQLRCLAPVMALLLADSCAEITELRPKTNLLTSQSASVSWLVPMRHASPNYKIFRRHVDLVGTGVWTKSNILHGNPYSEGVGESNL